MDLTVLSKNVKREKETLALSKGSTVFSKIHANSCFWQIGLEEESRELTAFIGPFGRFHFGKMPFGISADSSSFKEHFEDIIRSVRSGVYDG